MPLSQNCADTMVEIQDTLVSFDLFRECFCCDLHSCGGACCVEGDAGAPLALEEIGELEEAAEALRDELTPDALSVIDAQGVAYIDKDGQMVTSIVDGKDCVFAVKNAEGITLCAIDRACREGRLDIRKPISCALYPVRVSRVGDMTALNYNRWSICEGACKLGRELKLPLYKFLKEPLVRAFGQEWWDECDLVCGELKKQGYLD